MQLQRSAAPARLPRATVRRTLQNIHSLLCLLPGINFSECDFAGNIRIFLLSAHSQQFPDREVRERPPAPGWRVKAVCVIKLRNNRCGQLENAIFPARRRSRNYARQPPHKCQTPTGKKHPLNIGHKNRKLISLPQIYPFDFPLFCAGLLLTEFYIDSTFTHRAKVHFCKFICHFRTKMSAYGIQICEQCLFYGACHCSVYAKSRHYPVSEEIGIPEYTESNFSFSGTIILMSVPLCRILETLRVLLSVSCSRTWMSGKGLPRLDGA